MEVLSIAMDAQGPDRPRPYAAGTEFTTVVDAGNLLGQLYGFKAVPNGFLVDEDGVVRYRRLGGFDIRKPETASIVELWAAGSDIAETAEPDSPSGSEHSASNALFREGLDLYGEGNVEGAMDLWRQAQAVDPDNYIVKKQIWAVENPARFYDGDIDYAWQRKQSAGN